MHEASLVRPLLREIERLCAEHAGERLIGVTLSLGYLSGVDADYLRHAFLEHAPGTLAQGATLTIDSGDPEVACDRCHWQGAAALPELSCGVCGSPQTRLISGTDLLLKSLTFEAVMTTA